MLHSPEAVQKASIAIHYAYPPTMFLCFLVMQGITVCTLENLRAPKKIIRRHLLLWLQISVIATYVTEAALLLARSLVQKGWYSTEDHVVYVLSAILVWGVIELVLLDSASTSTVWYPYYGCWFLSLASELYLIALPSFYRFPETIFQKTKFGIGATRIALLVLLPSVYWGFQRYDNSKETGSDEESAGLLAGNRSSISSRITNGGVYGATHLDDTEENPETRAAKARMLKKIEESGNWWIYAKSFAIFWPYVWPTNDRGLKFSMVLVGICLAVERGLNVLVPHQLGVVTNALSDGNGAIPWIQVSLYVAYRWLDSGSGISALQRYLWMPIDQYSYRSITTAAYNHVMSLSHDFHTNKKTGELYTSVNQGRSVNGFIESVLFAVLPMLADLCVAFGYFFIMFNSYMALIVAVVSMIYLWATAKLGTMRNQMRRDFNAASREEASTMWETMSSWMTVSYFNRVPYEQDRYLEAIRKYQRAERNWDIGLSVLNVAQSLIFTFGLLGASFLAVYMVTMGQKPVGSFVSLLSYWAQLSSPLSFFANFYRKIQQQMLDAERLLELFQTKPNVTDRLGAKDLKLLNGEIEFDNVRFSYDPRKFAINGITFKAPGGSTIALVGETGGGKTTCLKLLFRFYDVDAGTIRIDGQDIKDVTIWSLRENMGVVPQDPELFNDTIMNNIRYANFDATDEQVYNACRAASIHEKIINFPDGYLSKVGERGVKLSGGELQRVAIARAILKDPKIILLDEATSMVDMETERQIQSAFKKLSVNRTMFVVAHRLSTIMNADLIIVIKEGGILEQGNHDELIEKRGKYYQLWSKQMKNEGPKPGVDATELTMVNDLPPSTREAELKKALENTGAGFHISDLNSLEGRLDSAVEENSGPPNPGIFMEKDKKIEAGHFVSAVRSNGSLGVSFAIQDSVFLNKSKDSRFRPEALPKDTSPAQSTLKNIDFTRQPEKQFSSSSNLVAPKVSSSLKPDAREFVPNEAVPNDITNKYNPTPQQVQIGFSTGDSILSRSQNYGDKSIAATSVSAGINQISEQEINSNDQNEAKEDDQGDKIQKVEEKVDKILKAAKEQLKELEGKPAEENIIGTQKPLSDEVRREEAQDEQPLTETQPDAEVRKKRRRSRRRSSKLKSSIEVSMEDHDGGGVIVTEYPETTPITTLPSGTSIVPIMVAVSPRPINDAGPSNIDGEGSNNTASALEKKPKRRFRARSSAKSLSPKAEPENQEPRPPRGSTNSDETSPRQYKGKSRASSFTEGDYRSTAKGDSRFAARDGQQSPVHTKQPDQSTSTSGSVQKGPVREKVWRKTWGKAYGSKATGKWKSGNDGPSGGLTSAYRKPSNETLGT